MTQYRIRRCAAALLAAAGIATAVTVAVPANASERQFVFVKSGGVMTFEGTSRSDKVTFNGAGTTVSLSNGFQLITAGPGCFRLGSGAT